MKRILSIFIILLSLCLPITATAIVCAPPAPGPGADWIFPGGFCDNILLVCPTSEYTTITEAMAAAEAWDTILVAEGTYNEAVTFSQNNIVLRAFGSAENTVITQAAGTTIDFSTKYGCMLDGFTVSLTAATDTGDEVINSTNNSATAYNTVKNCTINIANDSGTAFGLYGIRITDGNFKLLNNIVNIQQHDDHAVYTIWNSVAHTFECRENTITVDQDSTGANMTVALGHSAGAGSSLYAMENIIIIDSTHTGAGMGYGIYAGAEYNYVSGNTINADTSGTGDMCGIFTNAGSTAYYTSNYFDITTGDSDGQWASLTTGTSYVSGSHATGDGVLGTGGTNWLGNNTINGVELAAASVLKRYYPAILNDTTSPHQLTIPECSNTLITTQGWNGTDDITFVMPDISAYNGSEGVLKGKFLDSKGMQDADTDLYVDPDASTQIVLNGTPTGADGDRIWFDNIVKFSSIVFHSEYDPTLGGYWVFDQINGIVTDKGS